MCYDAQYTVRKQLKEAVRHGADKKDVDKLQQLAIDWSRIKISQSLVALPSFDPDLELEAGQDYLPEYFHASGFEHTPMVYRKIDSKHPFDIGKWGLVPFWVKSMQEAYDYKKPYNCNLNAQSESMFEKKAFQYAAKHQRCVINLNAYYEHHHFKKKSYPFKISHKLGQALYVAAIYQPNQLVDEETGELLKFNSIAILTCEANALLSKIHNNPKMVARTGHRMLVILEESQITDYLKPYPDSTADPVECRLFEKEIQAICQPFPEDQLTYHSVRNLRPRKDMPYLGNVPEISEQFVWPELDYSFLEE